MKETLRNVVFVELPIEHPWFNLTFVIEDADQVQPVMLE